MPHIQWYPGHIAKAERKLQEQTNLIDVILEVIDARIPLSSMYSDIDRLVGKKPRLLILNKADLADSQLCKEWKEYLEQKTGFKVILTDSTSAKDLSSVIKATVDLGKEKIGQLIAKGLLPRPVRVMVIGMPNVGKSSIINKLAKMSKAKVGAKAGITRIDQWIRVNPKMELLDTPGVIPVKLDDQNKAVKLAIVSSVSEQAYDKLEVAKELINLLWEKYPQRLKEHYNLEDIETVPTLDDIAKSRRWLSLDGAFDINRCASAVLSDFRHGRTGKITLDSIPQS